MRKHASRSKLDGPAPSLGPFESGESLSDDYFRSRNLLVGQLRKFTMRTTNSRWQNFWLGAAVGGMIAANLVFLVTAL